MSGAYAICCAPVSPSRACDPVTCSPLLTLSASVAAIAPSLATGACAAQDEAVEVCAMVDSVFPTT
jgi:hypothetical protein